MKDYTGDIRAYVELEIDALRRIDVTNVNRAIHAIDDARQRGMTTYVFGNGGSAATASHMANDFNKGLSEHIDQKFRFVCLSDNVATLMAIANDISYDEVFAFQLRGKVQAGDLVIAISGSGNSPNVLRAVELAKAQGAQIIAMTGFSGGTLATLSDISLNAPIHSMQVTEDMHMIMNHLAMAVLYRHLCGKEHVLTGKNA